MTTTDTQAAWDREEAHEFRGKVKTLAGKVRELQQAESHRKMAAREARKSARQAHESLTIVIERDDEPDDLEYLKVLRRVTAAAEAAREAERENRQEWVRAVMLRRRAQDELRVAVRRQFEHLPLFDGQPEPSRPEPPPHPVDYVNDAQARNREAARKGQLRVEVDGDFLYLHWNEPEGIFEAEARGPFGDWADPDKETHEPHETRVAGAVADAIAVPCHVEDVVVSPKGRPMFALRRVPRSPAEPVIEKDLEKLLEQESEADAQAQACKPRKRKPKEA